ncbi:uncharacterized protein LOC130443064 isoform X1 [Diorhabda sublineata]|uniref:uncharacterized protein LOC130443064 isoform X1 n=1 Tax=Diorhabda sublineata TaxID=1163346 RepID=UPI0024E10880|nr:uncharacterized protein LOC130443064 isoform X1 [Diorhabda sublineata]
MSLLEKIRMLNKEQLIIVIRENGFEGIAEILEDKDITGQTFLNLPTFQLISWNLSIGAMKTLTKFIEQVKNNPQILNRNNLLKAYQEKQEFSTNTSVKVKSFQNIDGQKSSHLNDFKNKLAITLNSEKSHRFQKPPMIDRDLLTNEEFNTISKDPSEFHMKPKPVLPLPKVREKIPTPRIHQIPFVRGKNSEYPDSDFIVDVNDTQNNYTRYIIDQSKRSAMCQKPSSYPEDNSSSLNIRKRLLTPTEVQGNLEIPEDINMSTEDLKFISHSNNNTYPSSYRQNLPAHVEVSINRFKNIEPLPSNLTKMIPDHEGITRLYKVSITCV